MGRELIGGLCVVIVVFAVATVGVATAVTGVSTPVLDLWEVVSLS